MIRGVFIAVSLLLFIGTAVLWVRSYAFIDQVFTQSPSGPAWWLKSMMGTCRVSRCSLSDGTDQPLLRTWYPVPDFRPVDPDYPNGWAYFFNRPTSASAWAHLGIRVTYGGRPGPHGIRGSSRYWAIVLPYSYLAGLFAAAPAVWLTCRAVRAVLHRRRRVRRICMICGYDLRASSDLCPECGTPITSTGERMPA